MAGPGGLAGTDDAYLQSDLTPISPKVAGYVRDLPIEDYQHVHRGQLLAQLIDDDYRAAVAQAEASILSASAQEEVVTAQRTLQLGQIEAARAVVAATNPSRPQNGRDLIRQEQLLKTGSSSTNQAGPRARVRQPAPRQLGCSYDGYRDAEGRTPDAPSAS